MHGWWIFSIDHATRLPVLHITTPGARADVTLAHWLIGRASLSVAIPLRKTNHEKVTCIPEHWYNRFLKSLPRSWDKNIYRQRTEIERCFSRKKNVFCLGEERTRRLQNFEANCSTLPLLWSIWSSLRGCLLFTKLPFGGC